ncbi:unnamed protein product [Paramecium octaurelia]|uniref:Transmembrane protein n=1 Tax=Paramecium octaurelia TaxID=43137 RepID=A0A8S1TIC3_PAROT|nr:unnamed protein product [Paramecium octaurelia]
MRSIEDENQNEFEEYKLFEYQTVTQYWISTIIFISSLTIFIGGVLLSYLFEPEIQDSIQCIEMKDQLFYYSIILIFIGISEMIIFLFGFGMQHADQMKFFGQIQKYQRIEQIAILFTFVIIEAYIYQNRRTCKINKTYYSLYAFYFWQLFWCAFVYNFENLT